MRAKVTVGVTIILSFLFSDWVALIAQNHPARVGILLGVGLVVAGAVWLLSTGRTPVVLLGVLLAGGGFGWVQGLDARDHELGSYCRYGAQNKAELDRCMSHVTTDDIDELDTHAADFGRGVTSECGPDSGPYCAEEAKSNGP